MNVEQGQRYIYLANKAALKLLTPPEEVELDNLSAVMVNSVYDTVPNSVKEEIQEYLDKGGPYSIEFYQGMIHAVRWINEATRNVGDEEVVIALDMGLSLLSLSVSTKVQQLQAELRDRLTNTLKLEVKKETPDDTF